MKKNLFFLFALICSTSLFTACSDDDEDGKGTEPEVPVLLKGETAYNSAKLALTYSGSALPGKDITFATTDGKTGSLTMKGTLDLSSLLPTKSEQTVSLAPGVIPGEVTTVISDIKLTQNGTKYTFEGTDTKNDRVITYTGEVDSTKLTLDLKVKMPTTSLTGTWDVAPIIPSDDWGGANKLQPIYTAWDATTPFKINMGFGDMEFPAGDLLKLAVAIPVLGDKTANHLLLSVLKDITFKEDGNIVATYSTGKNIANPQWTESPVNIAQYYVKDKTVYLLLNLDMVLANLTKTKASITDLPEEVLAGIINNILPMLSTGIPLTASIDGTSAKVFADTELLMKLMNTFLPLLQNQEIVASIMASIAKNEQFATYAPMVEAMLKQLPGVLATTSKMEMGINLQKK